MAKSFVYHIKNILSNLPDSSYKIPFNYKLFSYGIAIVGHLCYAITTKEEKEIMVLKKYKFDRNGFTEFMIIDQNGKHYNINNSLWYWKWNAIEEWNLIEKHKNIRIKFYGFRIPILGIFPNVFFINNTNNNNFNLTYGCDTKPVICLETCKEFPFIPDCK